MRKCLTCNCPEFDADGKPTHSPSFCWYGPTCEVKHAFRAEEPVGEVDLRAQVHNPR